MIAANEMTPEVIRDHDSRVIDRLTEENSLLKDVTEVQRGRITDLKDTIEQQRTLIESIGGDAKKWKHCLTHRDDLGEWLVDQATTNGKQTKFTVDAALGGEDFIPNSFTRIVNGKTYAFELVSTVYSVTETE